MRNDIFVSFIGNDLIKPLGFAPKV